MSQALEEHGDTDAHERQAVARCADMTEKSRSNFYMAFLPLPKPRREGIYCIYAFCRRIDNIVDEEPEAGQDPRTQLNRWRERVRRIHGEGLPPDENELALGLSLTHQRFGLLEEDMMAVIDGMEMDLDQQRYPTRQELDLYCKRVAGHVGCLCLPVFGAQSKAAREFALKLGHAFQLTNILRDVQSDAKIGRIYLPLEDLDRFGVPESDILEGRRSPALSALLEFERGQAQELFREASAALPPAERSVLYSASIMSAIYHRLLTQMCDQRDEGWGPRASLTRRLKVLLALGVFLRDRVFHLA